MYKRPELVTKLTDYLDDKVQHWLTTGVFLDGDDPLQPDGELNWWKAAAPVGLTDPGVRKLMRHLAKERKVPFIVAMYHYQYDMTYRAWDAASLRFIVRYPRQKRMGELTAWLSLAKEPPSSHYYAQDNMQTRGSAMLTAERYEAMLRFIAGSEGLRKVLKLDEPI